MLYNAEISLKVRKGKKKEKETIGGLVVEVPLKNRKAAKEA